jgi:hypothetical protein
MSRNEEPYYGRIEDDGRGGHIIRAIEQEPIRPEILPELPDPAHVLNTDKRCSQKNRDDAVDFLTEMHAEGFITAEELEVRRTFVLESVAYKMLTRVTRDFPESIDQWLKKKQNEEWARREAAKPKPPAPPAAKKPEDEPVPPYVYAGLVLGTAAFAGGVVATMYRSPIATAIALAVMGIAIVAVVLWRGVSEEKE